MSALKLSEKFHNFNARGAALPRKIRCLLGTAGRGDRTLTGISRAHALQPAALSYALSGRRSTARIVAILERETGESIEFLRALYREDRERRAAGNPITREEARAWFARYNQEKDPEGYARAIEALRKLGGG